MKGQRRSTLTGGSLLLALLGLAGCMQQPETSSAPETPQAAPPTATATPPAAPATQPPQAATQPIQPPAQQPPKRPGDPDLPPPAGGVVQITEELHDAGTVAKGNPVTHAFTIKNTGTGELAIHAKPG